VIWFQHYPASNVSFCEDFDAENEKTMKGGRNEDEEVRKIKGNGNGWLQNYVNGGMSMT